MKKHTEKAGEGTVGAKTCSTCRYGYHIRYVCEPEDGGEWLCKADRKRAFDESGDLECRCHCAKGQGRELAPWLDYAGLPIHDGDEIRHPDGRIGTVIHYPAQFMAADAWRVKYEGDQQEARLCLQVGHKGMAQVKDRATEVMDKHFGEWASDGSKDTTPDVVCMHEDVWDPKAIQAGESGLEKLRAELIQRDRRISELEEACKLAIPAIEEDIIGGLDDLDSIAILRAALR